ncbi:MAG: aldehyde dehydrogenase [Rhodospirillaceae bacterium]|nr:aldehyde dehydrogenase [Rhodospirillaceae bacterium]
MVDLLHCISPVDGSVFVERPIADEQEISAAIARAQDATAAWRALTILDRQSILSSAAEFLESETDEVALELTWQMGRPTHQARGELLGFAERARHMTYIANEALVDIETDYLPGFNRFIRREPVGLVLVVAPWNYPYLTAVNAVWPALLAGNTVILKHSHQTPLCSERFASAMARAGVPDGVFQPLHLSHEGTAALMQHNDVGFVAFTGSLAGGLAVQQAMTGRLIGVGLELGGKDPAYVRHDADIDHAVTELASGAFFNSGQSCCGIERIYVHENVYEDFAARLILAARGLELGDPRRETTTIGPMVRPAAADFVRGQIAEAVRAGARPMVDPNTYRLDREGSAYKSPQVLVNVTHEMRVMTEESFGPVVGIMKVRSDEEAIALMNDSDYGLTAAIWTSDEEAAISVGERVDTGTWFMNRCDYLDPELAWSGVKNSGYGCSLSTVGYEQLTRPKSFHLRITT